MELSDERTMLVDAATSPETERVLSRLKTVLPCLSHELRDVRRRALQNITSKLEMGLVGVLDLLFHPLERCFTLLDLEAAQIFRCRRIGRTPKEGGEPPHVADIITLRLAAEVPHGHIVDQPLTQRADRSGWNNRYKIVHRSTPQLKEPECSALISPRATPVVLLHPLRQHPSRAAGSCIGPTAA